MSCKSKSLKCALAELKSGISKRASNQAFVRGVAAAGTAIAGVGIAAAGIKAARSGKPQGGIDLMAKAAEDGMSEANSYRRLSFFSPTNQRSLEHGAMGFFRRYYQDLGDGQAKAVAGAIHQGLSNYNAHQMRGWGRKSDTIEAIGYGFEGFFGGYRRERERQKRNKPQNTE